jgi:hypothetical protein
MKTMLRTRVFRFSFLAGISLFVMLNSFSYNSYHTRQLLHTFGPFSIYDADAYGIPFSFYFVGEGIPRWSSFVWSELVADVVIALIFSFVIGGVSTFLWPKIKTPLL